MTDLTPSVFKSVPKRFRRLIIALGGFVIILLSISILLIIQLQHYRQPALSAEDKIKQIVNEIDKYVVLPSGETPTVATVSDPRVLKDQPFFAQAEIGDQILIFQTSKRAILWRPSIHKVVEVSALTLSTN